MYTTICKINKRICCIAQGTLDDTLLQPTAGRSRKKELCTIESLCCSPATVPQPCLGEGACITPWSCEPCVQRPPKTGGSEWRFWQDVVHREDGNPLQYTCLEPHEQWKRKRCGRQDKTTQFWKVSNMLWGDSRGQFWIAPERMKQPGQKQKQSSVVDVSSVVKSNIA